MRRLEHRIDGSSLGTPRVGQGPSRARASRAPARECGRSYRLARSARPRVRCRASRCATCRTCWCSPVTNALHVSRHDVQATPGTRHSGRGAATQRCPTPRSLSDERDGVKFDRAGSLQCYDFAWRRVSPPGHWGISCSSDKLPRLRPHRPFRSDHRGRPRLGIPRLPRLVSIG